MQKESTRILVISVLVYLLFTVVVLRAYGAARGTTAMQSLKIISAPRLAAMGEAFCAMTDDVNATVSNPASLSFMKSNQIAFTQNNWIEGITVHHLAVGLRHGIGLNLNLLALNDLEKRDNSGTVTGSFEVSEMIGGLTLARPITRQLGIGISGKMLQGKISDKMASGFAVDAGLHYQYADYLSFGVAAQNYGSEIKYVNIGDPLPSNLKAGVLVKPMKDMLVVAEANSPSYEDMHFGVGIEYNYQVDKDIVVPIRGGYRTGIETEGLSGLGIGSGIMWKNTIGLDLAWNPMGEAFGNLFKMGMKVKFGAPAKRKAKSKSYRNRKRASRKSKIKKAPKRKRRARRVQKSNYKPRRIRRVRKVIR